MAIFIMLNFLHNYSPSPVIFQIGKLVFYWYGLFIILGVGFGILIILKLAKIYQIEKEKVLDLSFLLIVFGIIGARLFAVLYNWDYFFKHPLGILKIWHGGMSIHGALIAGIIVLFFYCRKRKKSFWFFADLIAPGLILGQAIGRWGNYFNQELYGKPFSSFLGIPINLANRVGGYESFIYFHPVFLYEFILNLILLGILIWLHKNRLKHDDKNGVILSEFSSLSRDETKNPKGSGIGNVFLTYLISYSLARFFLEFLRIDPQPMIWSLRLGQWISFLIIIVSSAIIIRKFPCFSFLKRSQIHKS